MKKVVLTALGLVMTIGAFAQGMGRQDLTNYFNREGGSFNLRQKVGAKEADNATGSPYLTSSFTLGTISNVEEALLVKYNAYTDEIELDNGNNKTFILPKDEEFNTITLKTGGVYRLFNYKNDGKDVKGYLLEKLNVNEVSLLKKEQIILIPERQPVNGYGSYVPAKFEKGSDEYYLQLKDKSVVAFPKSKKKLIEIFPAKKSEIETFLKSNKVSFKGEQDMMTITNFIATL
jgi:hypothetical protein